MLDYLEGAWRDVIIQRDGTVLLEGERAGQVRGKPKAWERIVAGSGDRKGGYHTKREAGTACAHAYLTRSESSDA